MKAALIAFSFFFLCGCGTTWLIRRDEYGGIMGAKGYSSVSAAEKAIDQFIRNVCGGSYRVISSESMVGPASYATVQNMGYGNYYITQGSESWGKVEFKCGTD